MPTGLSREKWCGFHICTSSSPLERVASSSANGASWPTCTQKLKNCNTSNIQLLLLLYHAHLKIILKKSALNSSFFWYYNYIISLFPFSSLNPPIFHSLLFQTVAFFTVVTYIYVYAYILLNTTCSSVCYFMFVFRTDHVILITNQCACLWGILSPTLCIPK